MCVTNVYIIFKTILGKYELSLGMLTGLRTEAWGIPTFGAGLRQRELKEPRNG